MILITGATGNVGRPLVAQLLARGAKVRAISRHPNTAGLPGGAEVVEADPSRPNSLHGCFDGVTAIFLNARAVKTAASEVLTLAKRAGVARAVALAATNVDEDHARQPSRWRGDLNAELEQAVIGSGLEWVSLRPNEYASNFLGLWAAQLRSGNVIRAPYGASQHAPIDERDIAAVAVEALLTDRLLRQSAADRAPVPVGPRARRHARRSPRAADQIRRDSTRAGPPGDAGPRFPRRLRHRVPAAASRGGRPARSGHPHGRGDPGPASDRFRYLGG